MESKEQPSESSETQPLEFNEAEASLSPAEVLGLDDAHEVEIDANNPDHTSDNLDEVIPPHTPDALPVVGLGGSAGAIPALREFFSLMPSESGFAFVVIIHLKPDAESNLPEILQAATSMPVIAVNAPERLEANHIYVIPPGVHLGMMDGQVFPQPLVPEHGKRVAVDLFFRTLADTHGSNAVGIVISGADSDGVIGLKRIKERGGLSVVQNPDEAEHDGMPRAALATGMVDWILPIGDMPARLLAHRRNEELLRLPPEAIRPIAEFNGKKKASENGTGQEPTHEERSVRDEAAVREVLAFLQARTGHDFAHYKRATILRRIGRRLQVNSLPDIPSYVEFLRAHPGEAGALLSDLLISVTNFFRDPESFHALEVEIPKLFKDKKHNDQVRVWVAGCATGEEAYSVAMLLSEYAEKLDSPPSILVFATDLSESAIQVAREGRYPLTIEADVSPERLRRFFTTDGNSYFVRRELRELVLFAAHNLLRDSPFSRLELITCRNLLIYLGRVAQRRAFETFHFALKAEGTLFLGTSESADDVGHLFALHDKKHRLYTRRAMGRTIGMVTAPPIPLPGNRFSTPLPLPASRAGRTPAVAAAGYEGLSSPADIAMQRRRGTSFNDLHLALLEKIAPPSMVINEEYEIIHLSESAGRFLQFSGGQPSTNLLRAVHPMLRLELSTALFTATQRGEDIRISGLPYEEAGERKYIDLFIRPMPDAGGAGRGLVVVLFETAGHSERAPSEPRTEPIARQLDEELQQLKANLRATVEQYEVSVEELKASNEELQAMNEEARSTSEELETSKEELQAVNEELTTVNQELRSKVEDLSRANSDLNNLITSTDLATIFLDRELRIKRFTPRAAQLFNVIPTDLARPLAHLTHKLEYSGLADDAQQVLNRLTPIEREIRSLDGDWYAVRVLPYRTGDDRIDGVVLTLSETTERKRAEDALRASEEQFRRAIEDAPVPVIMQAEDGEVLQLSRTWTELTGYKPEELSTFEKWLNRAYGEGAEAVRTHMQHLFAGRQSSLNVEFAIRTVQNGDRHWSFSALSPGTLHDGRRFIVGMAVDITERKEAEDAIAEDLRSTKILHDLGARLVSEENIQTIYNEITAAAMTLMRADAATVQILDEGTQELMLLATVGFGKEMTDRFRRIDASSQTSCGIALAKNERTFIDFAAPGVPDLDGSLRMHVQAGLLSGLSTPLVSRSGKPIGMVSTHWTTRHHHPSERELRFLDLLARQAADVIELRQSGEALRESEEKYRTLFDSMDEGYCIIQMMHDEAGKAFDWRFLQVNRAFEHNNGLKDAEGKTIRELAPEIEPKWMEIYDRVAQSGESLRFEEDSDALGRSFSLYAFRIGEQHERKVAVIFRDITERKRAEEDRRESEQRLAAIFTQAAVGLCEISLEGRFIRVNDELCKILGRSSEELLTLGVGDVTHPDDVAASFAKVREMLETRQPTSLDKRFLRPDGALVHAHSTLTLLVNEAGEPESILAVTVDLTTRKATEVGLRESEERFRLLVEGTRDYAMFLMDRERRIIHWNSGAERAFGWTREEAIGQSGDMIFTPEDLAAGEHKKEAHTAVEEGRALDQRWHVRKDGSRFWADGVMTCLPGEDKQIRGFVKIARDATRQRESEEALQKANDEMETRIGERTVELAQLNAELRRHAEHLQQTEAERQLLLQRLVTAQEEERKRISRELHDQMGQSLTALKVGLSSILDGDAGSAANRLQSLNKLIDELTQQVHQLAWELRPAVLDNLGLETALEQVIKNWSEQSGIAADFASRGFKRNQRLLPHIESAFYRVVQEALTNVQRHAKATQVSVVLEHASNEVRVVIEDNGKGLPPKAKSSKRTKRAGDQDADLPADALTSAPQRLGLVGMRERMELLGGSFSIESKRGKGTTVYARAPIDRRSIPRD